MKFFKKLNADVFMILFLFVLCTISVYFFPPILNKLLFATLLVLIWFTKKFDYFFFAIALILISNPGGLFYQTSGKALHRIPLYNIGMGFSLDFFDVLIIILLLKSFLKGKKSTYFLEKSYKQILIYIGFLFAISIIIGFGAKPESALRGIIAFLIIPALPKLIDTEDKLKRTAALIFPFAFFILFSQFLYIQTGLILDELLTGNLGVIISGYRISPDLIFRRPTQQGMLVTFAAFISALYFYSSPKKYFNKNYLLSIIVVTSLSVFISATRSWIVMFLFVIIGYFLWVSRNPKQILQVIIITFSVVFIISAIVPQLNEITGNAFQRAQTVMDFAQGDITSEGSMEQRFSERLPMVLKGISINPVFGLGFTKTGDTYQDYHTGIFNQIAEGGIIGLIIYMFFWYEFYKKMFWISKVSKTYNKMAKVLVLILTGMMLMHFVSYQWFSFRPSNIYSMFLAYFFVFGHIIYIQTMKFSKNEVINQEQI